MAEETTATAGASELREPGVNSGPVDFVQLLEVAPDSAGFLQQLMEDVVGRTAGARACGLTVERAGRGQTVAHSGDLARVGDERQYELDDGPCLQSLRRGEVVSVTDMATETRWGAYPARAVAAGIRSTLSLPLQVGTTARGALNLYASRPAAFSEHDEVAARSWAGQASGALSVALLMADQDQELEHLQQALANRSMIAQAVGLLMERARCDAATALDALTRESQTSNQKLRDVARRLVQAHDTAAVAARPRLR